MQQIIDICINQFYSYFYFLLFLGAVFIIVYFCCYGKTTKKTVTFGDMMKNIGSWKPWKKPMLKKHENRSRLVFENIFQVPFKSIRPNFLRYTTGKNLELDGYNQKLGIAFEYQGIQHRQFTPLFHKTILDFKKQLERDEWKQNKCKEKGIKLLRIPDTIKFDDLEEYIRSWVKEQRLI